MSEGPGLPAVAIVPWGDVIEDFLDPIGLRLEDFLKRMTGGWLFGYISALQMAGYRPIIICPSRDALAPREYRHSDTGAALWAVPGRHVPEGRWPSLRSLRRWRSTPVKHFQRVLEGEGCTALIVQEYEYARFDRLVRMARGMGIPVYASFQGGDLTLSRAEGIVRRASLEAADGLIVASSAERERLRLAYPGLMTEIADIPNPIDISAWQPMDRTEARRTLGIAPGQLLIINHGRIDIWRKGLDVLLKAWSELSNEPDAELVLIGSGQDHDAFAALLKSSGIGNIRWLPDYTTDRTFLRTWLSAADAYVSASRTEGMPVAPLEAMACGLPVVVSDAQGLSDILADGPASGGIMVRREDADGLARALLELKHDAHRRNMLGRAARRRVEGHFSTSAVAAALGELLAKRRDAQAVIVS